MSNLSSPSLKSVPEQAMPQHCDVPSVRQTFLWFGDEPIIWRPLRCLADQKTKRLHLYARDAYVSGTYCGVVHLCAH